MTRSQLAIQHEESLVDSFITPARRDRWKQKLSSTRDRAEFLDRLNHCFLDDLVAGVERSRSAGTWAEGTLCYVIADERAFDGRVIELVELERLLAAASFGVLVSVRPGRIACYKGEAPANVIWLLKP